MPPRHQLRLSVAIMVVSPKFPQAFKSKTFEFFADIEAVEDSDGFYILDSAEEVITDQKVVVIKLDLPLCPHNHHQYQHRHVSDRLIARPLGQTQRKTINTQMTQALISSIFASISSFEASYFQILAAHVPFVEEV
ncbi:hypothetical protein FH972_008120 [Carpinus fangiana]|uniref:DUF641 domain-containing protein n=1 Tax=Carpinus fangiana TaxID=176857 RepID=A0A5N6QZB1_9ROSI|nr:hypothetical protein FH972_008120 [Carpinus fangiana]